MFGYFERVTIDTLLETEGIILADLSAQHAFMPEGLTRRVRNAEDYVDLQSAKFGETLEGLADFSRFLRHRNVYTTPKVVEEVKVWYDLVGGGALERLNENKDVAGRNKEVSHTSRGIAQIQQNVDSFYLLIRRLRKSASHALISKGGGDSLENYAHSIGYTGMEMMVIAVSDIEGSKRDFSERCRAWTGGRYDLRTDEQLVATALYVAVVLKKPVAVITADSDIHRITGDVLNAIACSEVPGAYALIKSVSENPVRIYFSNEYGVIEKKLDTSGLVTRMGEMAEFPRDGKEELANVVRAGLADFLAA